MSCGVLDEGDTNENLSQMCIFMELGLGSKVVGLLTKVWGSEFGVWGLGLVLGFGVLS
jgi:hypothetical protein